MTNEDLSPLDRPITLRWLLWAIVFLLTLPFSFVYVFPRTTLVLVGINALAAAWVLLALRGH